MFPFDSDDLPVFHVEGARGVRTLLGSQSARAAHIEVLAGQKIAHAAVEYRVFSRLDRGRIEVVVEVPVLLRVQRLHGPRRLVSVPRAGQSSDDLERIYIVLTPAEGSGIGTTRPRTRPGRAEPPSRA